MLTAIQLAPKTVVGRRIDDIAISGIKRDRCERGVVVTLVLPGARIGSLEDAVHRLDF